MTEPGSPSQQAEEHHYRILLEVSDLPPKQAIECAIAIMDDLIARSNNAATVEQIAAHEKGIGTLLNRAQLLASFLEARKPAKLRVVK